MKTLQNGYRHIKHTLSDEKQSLHPAVVFWQWLNGVLKIAFGGLISFLLGLMIGLILGG